MTNDLQCKQMVEISNLRTYHDIWEWHLSKSGRKYGSFSQLTVGTLHETSPTDLTKAIN